MVLKSWLCMALTSVAVTALPAAPAMAKQAAHAPLPDRPMPDAAYWNAQLPVAQRVADLLARMTLEEKVAQVTSVWQGKTKLQRADFTFDPVKARAVYPHGIGFFTRPSDKTGPGSPRDNAPRSIADSVAYANAVQKWAREGTRLGIPVMLHEESLHGLAALDATSYPMPIGLASTWNPDLVREVNRQIAGEARARGVQQVLSPVVDVARDPRWGRIEETFGEDPFLVGEMGVAAVEGLQGVGKNPKLSPGHVMATLKHMTGHGQPESGTNTAPAPLGERTLRDFFFPPFKQVIDRTAVASVMASYNEIDGIPSHSNKWLLGTVLRNEWNYQGAVVSDYFAIEEMVNRHHVAADVPEAARYALDAGVDVDFPDGVSYSTLLAQAKAGTVQAAQIDRAVTHALTMKFNAGLFEQPFVTDLKPALSSNTAAAVALARKAAEQSLVLLQNDGTLPLAMPAPGAAKRTIAVIGSSAQKARLGSYYGIPRATVSPLAGIQALVGSRANVIYAPGVEITKNDDWWADKVELGDPQTNRRMIAQAVETARGADTIVLFLGDTEQTSREGWGDDHLGDRSDLDLVGQQNELLAAVKALGKPVVVVLVNGRPPSYPAVAASANAVLETWYAGEQQGAAIADALFGRVNPSGKLPVTVARSVGQLPVFYDYKPSARRGYLFGTTEPLYPFGYGLSYTTFDIGAPTLSAVTIRPGEAVTVRAAVTNTGSRAGDEVVQVYLRDDVSSVTRPLKQLVGFTRVRLQPGERRDVAVAIRPEAFGLWNREMKFVTEPGSFTLMVGANARDIKEVKLTVAP
ncbi:glycoside hydrolase family 3 N-terminal domain-containing protein [Novosphingobium sp.]|uniref:glycoside hydrolase family 3 N-terminal domain-containing protein n=1 Tax=Novosphingobium sp. TaxID=1874826 RepID=UPI0025FBA1F8|nr:glycoside hydrolase family 3 N-terminal domain-containing protein [Novosphingobium sp.]